MEDPSHIASCRHSCRSAHRSNHPQPPLVGVTSADAPELLLSSSGEGAVLQSSLGGSPEGVRGRGSDQSAQINSNLSFVSSTTTCSEGAFANQTTPPIYVNLVSSCSSSGSSTSSSTISPCSLPSVSPPQLTLLSNKQFSPRTPSHSYAPHSTPNTVATTYTDNASLLSLSLTSSDTTDRTSCSTSGSSPVATTTSEGLPIPTSEPLLIHAPEGSPPSPDLFLSPRLSTKGSPQKRHQPYTLNRSPRAALYPAEGSAPSLTPQSGTNVRDYCCYVAPKRKEPSPFTYPSPPGGTLAPLEPVMGTGYSITTSLSPSCKKDYISGKAKVTFLSSHTDSPCRYTPYDRASRQERQHPQQQQSFHQLSPHSHPLSNVDPSGLSLSNEVATFETLHQHSYILHSNALADPYLQGSCNPRASCQFMGEVAASNQFYPSCTYGNVASFND